MAYLGNSPVLSQQEYRNIDNISGSFNGSTTSFALLVNGVAPVPAPQSSNQCLISVNGVVQKPDDTGATGFRISGGNIIFSSAPTGGQSFFGVILAGADYIYAGENFPDGTVSAPSITFAQDLDTGFFRSGAGEIKYTANGTAVVTLSSNNLTAPSFIPTSSSAPTNGVYLPAANSVGISTNSTERLRITSAGLVGIGSSSPATQFSVQNASTSFGVETDTTSGFASGPTIRGYYRAGSAYTSLGLTGSAVAFGINDVEKMRLTGTGLGIGTTSPDALVSLGSGVDAKKCLIYQDTGNKVYYGFGIQGGEMRTFSASSGVLTFGQISTTDGTTYTERFRCDTSGRLLVGTSTSDSQFDSNVQITAAGASTTLFSRYSNDTAGPVLFLAKSRGGSIGTKTVVQSGDESGKIDFRATDGTNHITTATITAAVDGTPGNNDMPGRLVFSTTADGASSPTERMRITNAGNVGIGTTSPRSKFDVSGDVYVSGGNQIQITGTPGGTGLQLIGQDAAESLIGTMGSQALAFRTASSERARIDSSGRLLVNFTSTGSLGATAPLQVRAADSGAWGINVLMRNSGNDYGYIGFFSSNASEQVGAVFCQRTSANTGSLVFETNNGAASAAARFKINNDGQLSSVVTGGSTLYPGYMARVWINFDGTSGSIGSGRASGNVSSVTDNGTGDYTINFSTSMPDTNYCVVTGMSGNAASSNGNEFYVSTQISGPSYNSGYTTTGSIRMVCMDGSGTNRDAASLNLAVFR